MMQFDAFPRHLDSLRSMLNARYQGRVDQPRERTRELEPTQSRPAFADRVAGRWLSVSLSKMPAPDGESTFDADDTSAWLWILAETDLDLDVRLVFGKGRDSVLRFFGLDPQHRTGDEEFDARYRVEVGGEAGERFLADPAVRAAIRALEPFAVLRIRDRGVFLSREIETDRHLDGEVAGPLIDRVLDLAAGRPQAGGGS